MSLRMLLEAAGSEESDWSPAISHAVETAAVAFSCCEEKASNSPQMDTPTSNTTPLAPAELPLPVFLVLNNVLFEFAKYQNDRIRLEIVQQPSRARVSGSSLSDRRPVHPPPIIKLAGISPKDAANMVMFVTLWTPNLEQEVSHKTKPRSSSIFLYERSIVEKNDDLYSDGSCLQESSLTRKKVKYNVELTDNYHTSQALMGPVICVPQFLNGPDGVAGLYFVYSEVFVKKTGKFKLKFDLYNMTGMPFGAPPVASVPSSIFEVFNPKDFPGVPQTTSLSRSFAKQGIKIRVRQ
ncbi:hypothetical protein HK100_007296 [Physocladia obscura]|uniref:Velvet domain-containing protein n=1 Tax=Physocladia obscura TaxID=109957 RepID=A0AAD5XFV7_9FUNG|nr:hypothetical protein HK100_007296 [Physocladia obscura]